LFGGVDPFEDFLDSASQGAPCLGVLFFERDVIWAPVENDGFLISKVLTPKSLDSQKMDGWMEGL